MKTNLPTGCRRTVVLASMVLFCVLNATTQSNKHLIEIHKGCHGNNTFNSIARDDSAMLVSTPGNTYYTYAMNYSFTVDTLPDIGSYTPSIRKLYKGNDGGLYALTDTVIMKRNPSGWVNTGIHTGQGIKDMVADQNGIIWTLTNVGLTPWHGDGVLKRYDGVLTHTFLCNYNVLPLGRYMVADDSGSVWIPYNSLQRFDTAGMQQYLQGHLIHNLHIDSAGRLFFLDSLSLKMRDSTGFTVLQPTIPAFWGFQSTTALHNGSYYIYSYDYVTGQGVVAFLTEANATTLNSTILSNFFFCWDSLNTYLTFDQAGKFWMLGVDMLSGLGHLYIQDTSLTASISGTLFYDMNQNGVYDAGDFPLPNLEVYNNATNQLDTTDINGEYTINLPGVVGMRWFSEQKTSNLPPGWSFTTPMNTIVKPLDQMHISGINHGLYSTATNNNIRAYGVAAIMPPGFTSQASFYIQNTSLNTLYNIDAWFINSAMFSACISQVPPTTVTANTFYWLIDSLAPLQNRVINLQLPMPSTIPQGTPITLLFYVNHPLDTNPQDDTLTINEVVLGAYDPNDKQVFPDRPEKTIAPDELLTYTIRFQNTGTAPATWVVLRDTLSPYLDITSLKFIGSSHLYTYRFNPGNELVITYDNINLPDSGTNFNESMGAITYTIRPLQGLPHGTMITNEAYIYFDYNLPILTNQTLSIIHIIGIENRAQVSADLSIFPNPSTGTITLTHSGFKPDQQYTITLFDLHGRAVLKERHQTNGNQIHLEISSLRSGLYIGQMLINDVPVTFKMIRTE